MFKGHQWLGRLVMILLLGAQMALLPPPAVATEPEPVPATVDVPRLTEATPVRHGDRTVMVRPIRTTRLADGREAVADRLVVAFQSQVSAADQVAIHRAAGARVPMRAQTVGSVADFASVVDVSGAPSLEAAQQAYQADARVRYVEPDYILRTAETPNDALFDQQWNMTRIQAPAAWNRGRGSTSRRIAILDCGVAESGATAPNGRPGHPDLDNRFVARRDFSGSAAGADDLCDHGTHVAGLAGATTNNGIGVAGVGYAISLMNGKVLDDTGSGTDSWVASGMRWAVDNGAQVINLSLASNGDCAQLLVDAANYARARNVVVVAAAGNGGSSAPVQPANCPSVIGVGSTNQDDTRAASSNWGAAWLPVAAPGGRSTSGAAILSTTTNGSYGYKSGTSMATPLVAGLAGLLWSTGRYTTSQAVIDRINTTADRVPGTGLHWRYGRINALAALAETGRPATLIDGGHVVVGATAPATSWYFAEGFTGPGFNAFLTILNPNAQTAPVAITYYLNDGTTTVVERPVAARGRATIAVHGVDGGIGPDQAVAARLTTSLTGGIIVERPMYFAYGAGITGGHNVVGATAPATTWYFAEGFTGAGFDEYLTIQNPNSGAAAATVSYFVEGESAPRSRSITLAANSRTTIAVHADPASDPRALGRLTVGHSTQVSSSLPLVVERPMYFAYGAGITGGHNVIGATTPTTTWYFAEGFTGAGFDEYLTLMNPNASAGSAEVDYFVEGELVPRRRSIPLAPNSRTTIAVHADPASDPRALGRLTVGHSTQVSSSLPLVVERPIYFNYSPAINGGHNVVGATTPATTWYFAEGFTGAGFDEYLTIQNPNSGAAAATINYFVEGESAPRSRSITLAANSRTTIAVHADPTGDPRALGRLAVGHATTIQSSQPVVIERPVYFQYTVR